MDQRSEQISSQEINRWQINILCVTGEMKFKSTVRYHYIPNIWPKPKTPNAGKDVGNTITFFADEMDNNPATWKSYTSGFLQS